jgi:hypothetical protein
MPIARRPLVDAEAVDPRRAALLKGRDRGWPIFKEAGIRAE